MLWSRHSYLDSEWTESLNSVINSINTLMVEDMPYFFNENSGILSLVGKEKKTGQSWMFFHVALIPLGPTGIF